MVNTSKYTRQFFPVERPTRKWVNKTFVDKAPVWCSVDLRDGNQSLIIPMSLEEKLEFFKLLVKIGFKEIEVGFPAASETEYTFLRTLIDNNMIPDDVTIQVLTQSREHIIFEVDEDAEYEKTIDIDLSKIVPTVSCPHLPENTHPASELSHIKIDQVVIGSCTNGRMEDMEAAYNILCGKKVADGVRCIIIPGTMQILKECVERGYVSAFIDAGAIISTPTCGPCLGGYMGILAAGERCIATTNRNFVGRMGHVDSEVYLASPATAAASAITGYITKP